MFLLFVEDNMNFMKMSHSLLIFLLEYLTNKKLLGDLTIDTFLQIWLNNDWIIFNNLIVICLENKFNLTNILIM